MMPQLLNAEQYNSHRSGNLLSRHGIRNQDFDLILLKGEWYVLTGVWWSPQEWILKAGLMESRTKMK
jgi:hypothetical protein